MNYSRCVAVFAAVVFALAVAAHGQSLADMVKADQEQPRARASHVYTNDDLPSSKPTPLPGPVRVVKAAPAKVTPTPVASANSATNPTLEYWRGRVAEAKQRLSSLQTQLNSLVAQRNDLMPRLFADRNALQVDPERQARLSALDTQIADKRKEIDQALTELDDVRDHARKAGVSSQHLN